MDPDPSPVAIVASDLHLSHKAPSARAEKDWYEVMTEHLTELNQLKYKLKVTVLYAGDIFDTWDSPAELINFALLYLPRGYAIAGQHDLPHHQMSSIEKSALFTLF